MVTGAVSIVKESLRSEKLGRFVAPFFLKNENPADDENRLEGIPSVFQKVWDENGSYIPPSKLFGAAARKYLEEINEDNQSRYYGASTKLADAIGFFDTVSGFEKPVTKLFNLELLRHYRNSKAESGKTYYATFDISNLRGLNYALSGLNIRNASQSQISDEGEKAADKYLSIVAKEIALAFADIKGAVCEFYRDGGDEFSVIAHGVSEDDIKQAIDRAKAKVEEITKEAGLGKILHAKYPDEPNRKGVSFGAAYCKVNSDFNLSNAQIKLDEEISAAKESVSSSGAGVEMLEGDELANAVNVINSRLGEIEGKYMPYTDSPPPWRWEERREFPFADKDISEYLKYFNKGNSELYLTGSTVRMLQTRKALVDAGYNFEGGFSKTVGVKTLVHESFFNRLYHIYEKSESITGLKNDHFMSDLEEAVIYSNKYGKGFRVMYVDIQNIAGMNVEKGTVISNRHISAMADKVWGAVTEKGGYRPYRASGANAQRIYCLVPEADENAINEIAAEINDLVNDYAKNHGIAKIPHPRHSDEAYKGVRVVMANGLVIPDTISHRMQDAEVTISSRRPGDVASDELIRKRAARMAADDLLEEMDEQIERNFNKKTVWENGKFQIPFNEEKSLGRLRKEGGLNLPEPAI